MYLPEVINLPEAFIHPPVHLVLDLIDHNKLSPSTHSMLGAKIWTTNSTYSIILHPASDIIDYISKWRTIYVITTTKEKNITSWK